MPRIVFSEEEQTAMRGLPHAALALYFWLRGRMDFKTALVGARQGAGISWRALYEDLYVEPHSGPVQRWPAGTAGIEKTRRTAVWLERVRLVEMRSDRNALRLIFFLPKALVYSHAQNKPDRNPTDHPDRPAPLGDSTGTRHPPKRLTRHTSEVRETSTKAAAATVIRLQETLVFPQAFPQIQREAIIEIAAQARLTGAEAQLLLDELRNKASVTKLLNPPRFYAALVQQLRAGAFDGTGASIVRGGGKALSEEEARMANEGGIER